MSSPTEKTDKKKEFGTDEFNLAKQPLLRGMRRKRSPQWSDRKEP